MLLSYPIWMFLGCQNHIADEYATRKAQILATPPALSEHWSPDIILRLDYNRMSELTNLVVNDKLQKLPATKKEFLGFTMGMQPKLSVQRLQIADAPAADEVQITATLKGVLNWNVGPKKGKEPLVVRIKTNAQVLNDNGELSIKMNQIDTLNVQLAKVGINPLKSIDLSPWLQELMEEQLNTLPPIHMGSINLPVRGLRLNSTPLSQQVEIRSNIDHNNSLTTPSLALEKEWELWVHQDTLLGWTQQKAFSMGVVGYGVAVDPVDLQISENNFELALRLWKIEGRGLWWREYTANGTIEQKKSKLQLNGDSVTEGSKSPKAGLVDPLALIAESFILDGISEQLSQSIPTNKNTKMNGRVWKLEMDEWSSTQNALTLSGAIDVSKAKKPSKK